MSLATFSVSERIAAMVEHIEVGGERGLVDRGGDHRHRLRLKLHRLADAVGGGLHLLDRALIEPLASTVWLVACWMAVILAVMSSVARAVWVARLFTSWATTAKPRPASPARAASMVALSASRLVWPAMSRIRPRIDSIASTWADSAWLTFDRLLGLVAGAGGNAGGDLDFGPGILDRADQAGSGLRGLAHRDRRLLGCGGDFAGLAQHAAGGGRGMPSLGAQLVALAGAVLDYAHHLGC